MNKKILFWVGAGFFIFEFLALFGTIFFALFGNLIITYWQYILGGLIFLVLNSVSAYCMVAGAKQDLTPYY